MTSALVPSSVAELVDAVRSCPRLLAVGAGTKPRLSAPDVTKVNTSQLRGMVEYEPSEFTFTARAGTAVREVADLLAERGQFLPFDPLWIEAGSTLGGTVAAGLSGPGRLRFGGLRDFILGARFVDGSGRYLRVGGNVVKNAAGFDLPKFFVGSLGRFGILTELTFKVFPAAQSNLTVKLAAANMESASGLLMELGRSRWEPQCLDILPGASDVYARLAGPSDALGDMAKDLLSRYRGRQLTTPEAQQVWSDLREFKWAHDQGVLIKVVLPPLVLPELTRALETIDDSRMHVSSGGNMVFISLAAGKQSVSLSDFLRRLSLPAMTLKGEAPLWCGNHSHWEIAEAVKLALDPENRFPSLNE
ncbi:MAG TPA: FAD-binding protein [Patescibacteria group bacterium]|nr:FAD-binding protein [Patescibacteria group bacterium]